MIKISAFSNFTVHIHSEVNISLEDRELFSFLSSRTIPDKHEPSFLRCEIAYVIISIMSFNRLWIGKLRFVIYSYICSRKKLRVLLLSFAALLILFIVPLSKSSLWTLSIRFISLHWLVMRFKDGTAYAALYMLIM